MSVVQEMWLEIARWISMSLQKNPSLVLKILNIFLICFIIWIIYKLVMLILNKIRPNVWYKTHKNAMDIIKNHLPKEK